MGFKVKKEVISPGKVWYVDERSGKPAVLDATPDLIRHWHDSGNEMLASGLVIPLPYEHQLPDPPVPRTRAEHQKSLLMSNAGEVSRFEITDGTLYAHCDVADPDVEKKIGHTIKWTSPYFTTFTGPDGKERKNVVAHLALTTRPRITKQAPFPTVAAALSAAETVMPDEGFAVSRAGRLTPEGLPEYPRAFSLYSGIPLALEDMADKPPPKKEGGEKKPPPKGGKAPPKAPPGGGEEDEAGDYPDEDVGGGDLDMGQGAKALVDKKGDISAYKVIADLLHTVGIELPDGVDAKNFCSELYTAIMDKVKGGGAAPEDELMPEEPLTPPPAPPAAPPKPKPPVVQEQAPLYMSLEQIEQIEQPQMKAMALSLHALQDQAMKVMSQSREARVARLVKNLPPSARARLLERVKASPIALSMDGAVDPLDETLKLLEESIREWPAMLSATTPSSEQPQPQQPPEDGVMTEERRQEIVSRQVKSRAGYSDKAPEEKKAS